jgi:hypothetical protein
MTHCWDCNQSDARGLGQSSPRELRQETSTTAAAAATTFLFLSNEEVRQHFKETTEESRITPIRTSKRKEKVEKKEKEKEKKKKMK